MFNVHSIKERIGSTVRSVTRCAKKFIHRITSEPGYADALARVVVAAVSLTCLRPVTVRFIREIAETFAALIRTLIANQRGYELGWGGIEPGWE